MGGSVAYVNSYNEPQGGPEAAGDRSQFDVWWKRYSTSKLVIAVCLGKTKLTVHWAGRRSCLT
jgi:hypothetical protein